MAYFSSCSPSLLTLCAFLGVACAPNQPAEDAATEGASADPSVRDSSGQSYAEAIATVCDADRLSGADPNDPVEAANQRNEYLVNHVKNADGIYFLTVFRTQAAAEQAESLTREAKVVKVPRCALADGLRAEGGAPSAAK